MEPEASSGATEAPSALETLVQDLAEVGVTLEQCHAQRRLQAQKRLQRGVKAAQKESISLLHGEYCAQPAHRRLRYVFQLTAAAHRPLCGAKCRDGHACKAKVVDGWNRCRMHGAGGVPKTEAGRAAIAASNRRRAQNKPTAQE